MSWWRKEPGHQQSWYWLCWTKIIQAPHVKGYAWKLPEMWRGFSMMFLLIKFCSTCCCHLHIDDLNKPADSSYDQWDIFKKKVYELMITNFKNISCYHMKYNHPVRSQFCTARLLWHIQILPHLNQSSISNLEQNKFSRDLDYGLLNPPWNGCQ